MGSQERGPRLLVMLIPLPETPPFRFRRKSVFVPNPNTVDQSNDLLSHIPDGGGGSGKDAGWQEGRQATLNEKKKKKKKSCTEHVI